MFSLWAYVQCMCVWANVAYVAHVLTNGPAPRSLGGFFPVLNGFRDASQPHAK